MFGSSVTDVTLYFEPSSITGALLNPLRLSDAFIFISTFSVFENLYSADGSYVSPFIDKTSISGFVVSNPTFTLNGVAIDLL